MIRAQATGVELALRTLCLFFVFVVADSTHAAGLRVGTCQASPGEEGITVPVILEAAEHELISGVQFDLTLNGDFLSIAGVTAGKAARTAGKEASHYALGPGRHRVIVIGMNKDTLSSGEVVGLRFDVAPGAGNGNFVLHLEEEVLSDPVGLGIRVRSEDGAVRVTGAPHDAPPKAEVPPSPPGGYFGQTMNLTRLGRIGFQITIIVVLFYLAVRSGRRRRGP